MFRLSNPGLLKTLSGYSGMKADEIIELADILQEENLKLRNQNEKLKQQLHRYRKSLESTLNFLKPEQTALIKADLVGIDDL